MKARYYILDNHKAVKCGDLETWARWFETANRTVAKDHIVECSISTVFLGIDHQFDKGPPLLFETAAWGHDQEFIHRTSTWEQAEAAHKKIVSFIRSGKKPEEIAL